MTQAKQIIELKDCNLIAEACEKESEAQDSDYSIELQISHFADGSRIEQDGIAREFRAYAAKTDSDPASLPVKKFEY